MSNSVINFNAPQYAEAAIAAQHATRIIRSITDRIDRLEPITLESPRGTLIGVGLAEGSEYAFAEFSLLNTQLSTIRGNTPLSMTGDAYLHLRFHKNDRRVWDFFAPPDNDADPCMSEDAAGATDPLARDRADANVDSVSAIGTTVPTARDLVDAANCSVSTSTTTSARQDESLPLDPLSRHSQDDFSLTKTTDTPFFSPSILGGLVLNATDGRDGHTLGETKGDAARVAADDLLTPHSPIPHLSTPRPSDLRSGSYDESMNPPSTTSQLTQASDHHLFGLHDALTSDAAEGQEGQVLDKAQQVDAVPAAADGRLAPHLSDPRSIVSHPSVSRPLPYDGTPKSSMDDGPRLRISDYNVTADRSPQGEIDSDTAAGQIVHTSDKARQGKRASQSNTAAHEVARSLDDRLIAARTITDGPLAVYSLNDSPLTTGSPNSHLPPSNTTTDATQVNTLHIRTSDFDSTMERSLHSDIDSDAAEECIMGIAQHGNSALQPSTIAQENAQPTEGPTLAQAEAESASQLSAATLETARAALESLFGPRSIASRPRRPLPTRFPLNRPPTPPIHRAPTPDPRIKPPRAFTLELPVYPTRASTPESPLSSSLLQTPPSSKSRAYALSPIDEFSVELLQPESVESSLMHLDPPYVPTSNIRSVLALTIQPSESPSFTSSMPSSPLSNQGNTAGASVKLEESMSPSLSSRMSETPQVLTLTRSAIALPDIQEILRSTSPLLLSTPMNKAKHLLDTPPGLAPPKRLRLHNAIPATPYTFDIRPPAPYILAYGPFTPIETGYPRSFP
ncbi:hypothetical protein BDZ97DRAFT_1934954 [Flammula alnicola]|nr:hypothetical protein BDZ97DRAFT_1934954 [Flammula alnicola]